MDRDVGLLGTLRRHAGANLAEDPLLKVRRGLDGAATDDERVGIEDVHHLVEEHPQRARLYPEDVPAHHVAGLREAAHALGRVGNRQSPEFVARMPGEKVRQQQVPDRGERAHGLEIADAPAVAAWRRAIQTRQVAIRKQDVTQLAAKPVASLDHLAVDDDTAAKPVPTIAEIEVLCASAPKIETCPQSAPALPSLR